MTQVLIVELTSNFLRAILSHFIRRVIFTRPSNSHAHSAQQGIRRYSYALLRIVSPVTIHNYNHVNAHKAVTRLTAVKNS